MPTKPTKALPPKSKLNLVEEQHHKHQETWIKGGTTLAHKSERVVERVFEDRNGERYVQESRSERIDMCVRENKEEMRNTQANQGLSNANDGQASQGNADASNPK